MWGKATTLICEVIELHMTGTMVVIMKYLNNFVVFSIELIGYNIELFLFFLVMKFENLPNMKGSLIYFSE